MRKLGLQVMRGLAQDCLVNTYYVLVSYAKLALHLFGLRAML